MLQYFVNNAETKLLKQTNYKNPKKISSNKIRD